MASLNLGNSWHTYTKEKVDELVATGKIGNYAFGYLKEGDTTYYVTYVGRSERVMKKDSILVTGCYRKM